jgi:hypothetical protein
LVPARDVVERHKSLCAIVADADEMRPGGADQQTVVAHGVSNQARLAVEASDLAPSSPGVAHDAASRHDRPGRVPRASREEADITSRKKDFAGLDVVDAVSRRRKDHRPASNFVTATAYPRSRHAPLRRSLI